MRVVVARIHFFPTNRLKIPDFSEITKENHPKTNVKIPGGIIMVAYGVAKLRGRKMSLDAVTWNQTNRR